MKPRQIFIVAGIVLLVGAKLLSNFLSDQAEVQKRLTARGATPVAVQTAHNSAVKLAIPITGRLVARQKIEVFAEVPGILKSASREFREGVTFTKGEVLLSIDNREAANNLLAAKSLFLNQLTQILADLKVDFPDRFPTWKAYVEGLNLNKPLPELPNTTSDKEKFFITSKNIYNQFYTLQGQEIRLSKYRVTAPFTGVVTQSAIDKGSLIRAGQKLGEFIQPHVFELEAAVSVGEASLLQPGDSVTLHSSEMEGQWTGIVARVSDKLDPGTQSIKLFIDVESDRLREGMFLEGAVSAGEIEDAVELPRSILVNENKVYTVKDSTLHSTAVTVLRFTEDRAIVRGIADGSAVVVSGVAGAYDGMVVQVNEETK